MDTRTTDTNNINDSDNDNEITLTQADKIENESDSTEEDKKQGDYVCICPGRVYKNTAWHVATIASGMIFPTVSVGILFALNTLLSDQYPHKSEIVTGTTIGAAAISIFTTGSLLFFGTKKATINDYEQTEALIQNNDQKLNLA